MSKAGAVDGIRWQAGAGRRGSANQESLWRGK